MVNPQLIRCMHDAVVDARQGGLALVYHLDGMGADELRTVATEMLAANSEREYVAVFVAGKGNTYVAESYDLQGTPIQFCGHGALAAARVILDQQADSEAVLNFSNHMRDWQAQRALDDAVDVKLIYKRPDLVECAVPDFALTCLGATSVAAAEVGAETDYLILELADAVAVQELQPDFEAITAATRRALIVTAAAGAGCVFRYFAPQYNNPEDAATGSAAVQLAAYWAPRVERQCFTAEQLSASGACMQLACEGGKVELAARVRYG